MTAIDVAGKKKVFVEPLLDVPVNRFEVGQIYHQTGMYGEKYTIQVLDRNTDSITILPLHQRHAKEQTIYPGYIPRYHAWQYQDGESMPQPKIDRYDEAILAWARGGFYGFFVPDIPENALVEHTMELLMDK